MTEPIEGAVEWNGNRRLVVQPFLSSVRVLREPEVSTRFSDDFGRKLLDAFCHRVAFSVDRHRIRIQPAAADRKRQRTTAAAVVCRERNAAAREVLYHGGKGDRLIRVERQAVCGRPGERRDDVDVVRLDASVCGGDTDIARREQVFEIGDVQHRIRRRRYANAARAAHVLRRIGGNHHIGERRGDTRAGEQHRKPNCLALHVSTSSRRYFGGGLYTRYGRPLLMFDFSAQTPCSNPAGSPDWSCWVVRPVTPDALPRATPTLVPLVVVSK